MINTNQTDEVITERRGSTVNGVTEFSDRVHWGAIIAGLMIAISSQLLLSAIGAAIGFGSIADSGAPRSDSGNVAGNVGIWTIISLFISLFIGGWVTARAFGSVNRSTAALNGAILWATTLAMSSFLLAIGVTGAFGLAAANANRIANQAQQSGVTLPDASNSNPFGGDRLNTGATPSPIPTLSAQQTRDAASNGSKASWAFTFGSLLGLAAAMVGASVGARNLNTHRSIYNGNGHSQA
ncbi:MAG: hypothetical protein AUK48_00730 [Oscillatoriales cyanobacterium CG2_30_44_21]|nr:MAG: hypothetical protein AUK48_00730 [Oscillatoriales cyanobacterium CG2_30_44_21]